jgi:extracellular elastinolytic metalloproteinase
MKTNPTTYGTLNQPGWSEAHRVGEVWANVLYEMYWNLMAETSKYNQYWYSADLTAGNTLSLALVVEAMKLQPCNPTFVAARDALLQAEKQMTGGKHHCAIWRAFAKRGVGYHATSASAASFCAPPEGLKAVPRQSDKSLPPECKR